VSYDTVMTGLLTDNSVFLVILEDGLTEADQNLDVLLQ